MIPEYHKRVMEEENQLINRLVDLHDFIGTPTYKFLPIDEQARLKNQLSIMKEYSNILRQRIINFPKQESKTQPPQQCGISYNNSP